MVAVIYFSVPRFISLTHFAARWPMAETKCIFVGVCASTSKLITNQTPEFLLNCLHIKIIIHPYEPFGV